MNLTKRVLVSAMILLISVTGVFAAGQQEAAPAKEADLVYVNWAEGVAYTHLAKVVLEEKMGYEVNITAADVGPAYTAIAQGDMDAFMESWLPILHRDYYENFGDDILDLGHVYEDTLSGLVVPEYVTIDKISELNDHVDKFNGVITGIDAGAGVMITTEEEVIPRYNLELELLPSSGPAMAAALDEAINRGEWIVVTGWDPHWKFGRYDLKFLEQDEDKIVWDAENIHILGRKDLDEDKPELAQFLRNMFFTVDELADLMLYIEEADVDVLEAAREWMYANEEVVQAWIP